MKGHKKRRSKVKKQNHKMTIAICAELMVIGLLSSLIWSQSSKQYARADQTAEVLGSSDLAETGESETVVSVEEESTGEKEGAETDSVSSGDLGNKTSEKPDILLVNKDHPLPEDYEVELIRLPDRSNHAAEEAYEPLMDMLNAGRKEGLSFEVCSSYRDVERQQELFDEDVEELMNEGYTYRQAYAEVSRETMPPGYSEHSTGLAFDIVALSYQMLDAGQEKTKENIWLREHCAEYGFILRYPEDTEDITGISYESWHFRYVGLEAAEEITQQGITLEEYLGVYPIASGSSK